MLQLNFGCRAESLGNYNANEKINYLPQRGYSLYRGTHFKDNEGFEANWMQCEAF